MNSILFALWFFLPAGLANSAPVFANKIPVLNRFTTPLDFGAQYRGKRLLGKSKTWRGLLFGLVIATVTLYLQVQAYESWQWVHTIAGDIDYSSLPILLLGPLFGLGALLGDAIESFFKRQRGVPSGESWFPFDQLDYIIGGLLLSSIVVVLSFKDYLLCMLVWFCIHLIATYIGYVIGLRDAKI